ncbi:hypothetical protein D0T84_17470 [Dysgonomonas sp. 521]|uniref:hypothetical protein n=1 Tax=Dysgonomonas sp. 521 TaxID=2302932 RepID=UPI0013D77C7C|nr:hypothetical protein [Dysgonomonas sp. 521]NDV96689.1 hypothetical protein [Dysgonomonas sp. 521]
MNHKLSYLHITLFIFILSVSCGTKNEGIQVQFVEVLQGDFSFAEEWSYPENVFMNSFGQLVCDGLCDDALYRMIDKDGRIFEDSLSRYYQFLDTTRYYHTMASEAQCYEWMGTDYAIAYQSGDSVRCYTMCNAGTHSSLVLSIIGDRCTPRIELNSVANPGVLHYYEVKSGSIKIDEQMWRKRILKAEFDFSFTDTDRPEEPMWWQGKIYTEIKPDGEV